MSKGVSEVLVNEILDQFIEAGNNPSDGMLVFLAESWGKTKEIVRDHYAARYRSITGNSDDPYGPVMPIKG